MSDPWVEYLLRQVEARIEGQPISLAEASTIDREAQRWAAEQREPWVDDEVTLDLFPGWTEGK